MAKRGRSNSESSKNPTIPARTWNDQIVDITALKRVSSSRKGTRNAGQSVASQAAVLKGVREKSKTNDVSRFLEHHDRRSRRPNEEDPFVLVYPYSDQRTQQLDLSFLAELPNLAEPFLDGARRQLDILSARTRVCWVQLFRRGLCEFLKIHQPSSHLSDLNRTTFIAYLRWQDSPRATKEGKRTLATTTARRAILAGRKVFERLRLHPKWGEQATHVLDVYPGRTHPNPQAFVDAKNVLPRSDLEAIYQSALAAVAAIRARMDEGVRLIAEGRSSLADGNSDLSNVGVVLAILADRYEGVLPPGEVIRKQDRNLGNWVYGRSGNQMPRAHGITRLSRYLYASSLDLVPLIVLLTIEGAYNPETILSLNWSDVRHRNVLGVPVVTIDGQKRRARTGRYSKDLDPVLVNPWLELLMRLTIRLRTSLPSGEADRIFVFSPERATSVRAKAFSSVGGPTMDVCWSNAIAKYIRANSLPKFTLKQLRLTLLDQVGQRHGSLAAHRAAQHQQFQTTDGHYTGPGTRERERERLGVAVQQMERWIATKGQVDVRRAARSSGSDKGAATPGFACSDPYDSPIEGQAKNRLCRAYGKCPICPMALVNQGDHEAVAQWMGLENAIHGAREALDPQHWLSNWSAVLKALRSLIRKAPASALVRAKKFTIVLPPVG